LRPWAVIPPTGCLQVCRSRCSVKRTVQRVVEGIGGGFTEVQQAITEDFLPALSRYLMRTTSVVSLNFQ
jgi:hypothetical protein